MAKNPFAPSVISLADFLEIMRHVTDTRMRTNNVKMSIGHRFKFVFPYIIEVLDSVHYHQILFD